MHQLETPTISDEPLSKPSLAHRAAEASRQARQRFPLKPPHPATSRPADMDDDELRYLRAIVEFKSRNGLKFLTATQYFHIFMSLGYRRRS